MKPTMLLYALLLSGSDALNYRILALVLSAEILLCIRLVYLCARRYASKEAAQAGCMCFFVFACGPMGALAPAPGNHGCALLPGNVLALRTL